MKAIEKKELLKLVDRLNAEVERAEQEVEIASNKVQETDYDKDAYSKYQQKYNYLNGTMMMKNIVLAKLRKLGIEVK